MSEKAYVVWRCRRCGNDKVRPEGLDGVTDERLRFIGLLDSKDEEYRKLASSHAALISHQCADGGFGACEIVGVEKQQYITTVDKETPTGLQPDGAYIVDLGHSYQLTGPPIKTED